MTREETADRILAISNEIDELLVNATEELFEEDGGGYCEKEDYRDNLSYAICNLANARNALLYGV